MRSHSNEMFFPSSLLYFALIQSGLCAAYREHFGTYDFIIVGSGSAGCVIANRLSEIPHWNILLLETGTKESFLSKIPLLVATLQFTDENWQYKMEKEDGVGIGLKDEIMPWPRGKALGGTSVINYMIYTRGQKENYDKWGESCPGWSYNDVLPFFKKSEDCGLKNPDRRFHGFDGNLRVEDAYQSGIMDAFIDGLKELGMDEIDYNSNQSIGVSRIQANVKDGRRFSVAKAFLDPIWYRMNLRILTRAYVTKILIDPETKTAYGVEFQRYGVRYTARAVKEVILSAGAIMSPQLLMLSGIGPKSHLEELGIEVLADLPVGQNLDDHLAFVGMTFTTDFDITIQTGDLLSIKNIFDFWFVGEGPYTSLGGAQGIAYYRTGLDDDPAPDIELLFIGATHAIDLGLTIAPSMGISHEVFNGIFGPIEFESAFMIFPILIKPKSKGYVKLRSTDPFDYPILHGNYFSDPGGEDLSTFLAGVRYVQKLSRTKTFRRYRVKPNIHKDPKCDHLEHDSDDYWICALRSLPNTLHHQVGTVKMGAKDDPEAVVNRKLQVFGIRNLRVADTSVIPFSVGAHTNAPSVMVGEKTADIIRQHWHH